MFLYEEDTVGQKVPETWLILDSTKTQNSGIFVNLI